MRMGIIGLGGMGAHHAKYLAGGEVPGAELTAICDPRRERHEFARETFGDGIGTFSDVDDLLSSGIVDGVLIATPHFTHPELAVKAFEAGLHVLLEKPAGGYTRQAREMNEVAAKSGRIFGIMFQQRTDPRFRRIKEMVDAGEVGEMKRCSWIITDWFRTQAYYDSAEWRGTWAGEGGGVLLNQCPHNLDLWQWICGMPKRVRAFCGFGRRHDIEVEDEVTAYVEYDNGATGLFVAGTGESPGSNRFEIAGDGGKLVLEHGTLTLWETDVPVSRFIRESDQRFGRPGVARREIEVKGEEASHAEITRNWVSAVANGTPLLAPGADGIRSLELSCAMLLSAWTDAPVDLPIDDDLYYEMLQERMKAPDS